MKKKYKDLEESLKQKNISSQRENTTDNPLLKEKELEWTWEYMGEQQSDEG